MPSIFYILLRRLRVPLIVLITIYAVSILGFVMIPGQDDQGQVWQMSFFHAFYFVSYMASTIGFGEIPYAFSEGQRLWTVFTIYASVIGWIYSIGATLGVLQDPAFVRLRREHAFRRAVQQLRTPFYLICGYGDTGSTLVQALADDGIPSVVIDLDENRINELLLTDFLSRPLGMVGDASKPVVLERAGVTSPWCMGCIALTDSDQANLLIALCTEVLNPPLRLLARAETAEMAANINSFGGNEAINPFETFADQLELALNAPCHYTLSNWLSGMPHQTLSEPVFPGKGVWVLAGFGRFGKALYRRLQHAGIQVQVIDVRESHTRLPGGSIIGLGTEADTLKAAGVETATGVVAGTPDDGNNLSILMTARELNPDLFMVARQNQRDNGLIYDRAGFQLTMKRGDVIAHRIYALLRTPLIRDFLTLAMQQNRAWVNLLLSRIIGVVEDEVPLLWEVQVSMNEAPALFEACMLGGVRLEHLLRHPRDREQRVSAIPLLLKRAEGSLLLPAEDTALQVRDRILMCARRPVQGEMDWACQNHTVLHYLMTGEELSGSWLWRRLRAWRQARSGAAA
ncbi:MAG TPA: NAD-binding protein [Thiolinea sp.]|nr:NAD-binding protein [Thiolinea sp.]